MSNINPAGRMSATSVISRYGWLLNGVSAPDMVTAHVDVPTNTVVLNVADYHDSTIKHVSMDREYAIGVMLQLANAIRALT